MCNELSKKALRNPVCTFDLDSYGTEFAQDLVAVDVHYRLQLFGYIAGAILTLTMEL